MASNFVAYELMKTALVGITSTDVICLGLPLHLPTIWFSRDRCRRGQNLRLPLVSCKGTQDSLGFWIPSTGFQSLSLELGFWITIVSGIPDRQ